MDDEDTPAVVIDSGSGMLRAGFAGDDAPPVNFPNVIGTPLNKHPSTGMAEADPPPDRYIGDKALAKKGSLALTQPVQRGIVTDWDDMEAVVWEVLSQLRLPHLDRPVLMSEPPHNPASNRELLAQMMFEKFDAPAFHVIGQGVLALFATGRHAGVVVNCGDGVTYVTPIEGLYSNDHATLRVDTAGGDLTSYMQTLASENGYNLIGAAGREIARQLKEELCYVAMDYDQEMMTATTSSSDVNQTYTLPDGTEITLGNQRFRVPEALFRPSLIGKDHEGIQELVYKSIMALDSDVRSHFSCNILLCGGSTMFYDFGERLKKEISLRTPSSTRVKVVDYPDRKYSVWIGGSILASLSCFEEMWVTRAQYDEEGPSIMHKKCS